MGGDPPLRRCGVHVYLTTVFVAVLRPYHCVAKIQNIAFGILYFNTFSLPHAGTCTL